MDASEANTPGRYSFALDEARRTFDDQASQFGKARSAMGALLGHGGVSFSVLVIAPGQLTSANQKALLVAAGISFVTLCLVAAIGMWPRNVVPGASPSKLVDWVDRDDASAGEIARNLALHLDHGYASNAAKLKVTTRCNMACVTFFSLTIILLMIRLVGV